MPALKPGDYVVSCNQSISMEPFKVFEALNFVQIFKPDERKIFSIQVALVGEMMKPDNWVGFLNGIKKDYIVDEERKEISRKLFGELCPLFPR